MNSAMEKGIVLCLECYHLNSYRLKKCRNCHHPIHARKYMNTQYAWAWLITALVFLVPANIYPITVLTFFGQRTPDTILSGIVTLSQMDMLPIAIIVFVASIAVPAIKIICLGFIYYSVKRPVRISNKNRTRMFHVVEWIGRWSMMDLFVISVMAVLLDMGHISQFEAGPATVSFAAAVICTMVSAKTFDTRTIWDNNNAR